MEDFEKQQEKQRKREVMTINEIKDAPPQQELQHLPFFEAENKTALASSSFTTTSWTEHKAIIVTAGCSSSQDTATIEEILNNEETTRQTKKQKQLLFRNIIRKRKCNEEDESAAAIVLNLRYNLSHIPRILKNDLRRQYMMMWGNVYNSGNYEYAKEYLEVFCPPEIQLTIDVFDGEHHKKKDSFGRAACANEWWERMHDAPDLVCTLVAAQLKMRSDGTSSVIGRFQISGTRMEEGYPCDSPQFKLVERHHGDVRPDVSVISPHRMRHTTSTEEPEDILSDPEFCEAFEDYLQTPDTVKSVSSSSSIAEESSAPINQENNDHFHHQLHDDIEYQQSTLLIPQLRSVPFRFDGDVVLRVDVDSRIIAVEVKITILSPSSTPANSTSLKTNE